MDNAVGTGGFGDAARYAEPFIWNGGFILQAGDVAALKKQGRNRSDHGILRIGPV